MLKQIIINEIYFKEHNKTCEKLKIVKISEVMFLRHIFIINSFLL